MGRKKDELLTWVKANRKNCSSKDIARLLRAFGFRHLRTRGSHEFWQRGTKTLTLVLRNPVKVGYVHQVVKLIESLESADEEH